MNRMWVSIIMVSFALSALGAAQDKAQGEKVYADQKCAVCHSIAGKGNAKGPLDDVGSKLSFSACGARKFMKNR